MQVPNCQCTGTCVTCAVCFRLASTPSSVSVQQTKLSVNVSILGMVKGLNWNRYALIISCCIYYVLENYLQNSLRIERQIIQV